MRWDWTGWKRDSTGKMRRTGFDWFISKNIRISSFSIPSKNSLDKRNRRLILEAWKLHIMATWGNDS